VLGCAAGKFELAANNFISIQGFGYRAKGLSPGMVGGSRPESSGL
jgi:hypothetical protein